MYHMDQVRFGFVPLVGKTLNRKCKKCQLAEPENADSKRFCTLQVTICADPDQQLVPLEIIFRGQGNTVPQVEKDLYARLSNIRVRWQDKAWADGDLMMEYFHDFRSDTIEQGEVLLGMDNHSAQHTLACRCFMEDMHIVPVYTPADCTDCTSPVDYHVGVWIKQKINARFEEAYDRNLDAWNRPAKSGGLTASTKRMLLAEWSADAWSQLCHPDNNHIIKKAFVKTGFLVAKDGSENHLIELRKGFKYDFTVNEADDQPPPLPVQE